MSFPKLLVIGGPSSGKSSFRVQLFHRLDREECSLRLAKSVQDMATIAVDSDRMANGLQPLHTSHETYNTASYEVVDTEGRRMTLEFADYGGEQIRSIETQTSLPAAWEKRANEAELWLFFLRIDHLRARKNFLTDPVEMDAPPAEIASTEEVQPGSELRIIETLQRLLFAHGTSFHSRISSPRLGVLLSCWDELSSSEMVMSPREVLSLRGPLLSNFLSSNWQKEALMIFGLSSTERPLPSEKPDADFAKKGLFSFGYVIDDHGRKTSDLTLPIEWLWRTANR